VRHEVTYCCYYFIVVSKVDDVVDSPSSVVASADVTHGTQDDIVDSVISPSSVTASADVTHGTDGWTALFLMEVKC